MFCENCGSQISDWEAFCPNCGTPVIRQEPPKIEKIFCANCGNQISEGEAFCSNCGTPVEMQQTVAMPQQTMQMPQQTTVQTPPPKKKKRTGVIIGGAVALVAVIAVSAGLILNHFNNTSSSEHASTKTDESSSKNKGKDTNQTDNGGNEVSTETAQEETVYIQQEMTEAGEETVKSLYLDKLTLEAAVRTLIADRLNSTSFYQVDAREEYNITEVLIDEATGNPIVSEGVKAALKAVSDKKSLSEIVSDTVAGAESGVSDYLTGVVQDTITDAIGVNVFSAIDFINEWKNADSTPTVLLQNIVNDQKSDVAKLDEFLQQDEMNASDILKLSQLVYCIHVREQEINAITGEISTDSSTDYTQLEQIAQQYAQLEEKICAYADVTFPDDLTELTETAISDIQTTQGEVTALLDESQTLDQLSVGNIAVNYDVKGFIITQKNASQSSTLGKTFLGNLLGGLYADDVQTIEDGVQENRGTLCNKITDYMEESFQKVAKAKSDYDGKAALLQWIGDTSGDDLYFVKYYVDNNDWKSEYESARSNYVDALEKYLFDLSCAYQFYDCILTENQSQFLSKLETEMNNVKECVDLWDPEETGGYTKEEKDERYTEIVKLYVDSVDYLQIRAASLGQTPGFRSGSQVTKYGNGEYYSYVNGDSVILVIHLRLGEYIYGENAGVRCYYDKQGNPIYCSSSTEWVSYFNNEVMAYELMNDSAVTSYQEFAETSLEIFS